MPNLPIKPPNKNVQKKETSVIKHENSNIFIVFCVLIFAVLTEYLHLLFEGEVHSYYMRNGVNTVIYLSDMVYYLTNESFTLFLIIIAFMYFAKNAASKSIMAGVVVWFVIEWLEITMQLVKMNDSRLYINDGSWLQIFTCLTISLLVLYLNKKLIFAQVYLWACQFIRTFTKNYHIKKKK